MALAGFRTYVQTGIVLEIASNPVIPVSLQLGELAETVSVEASAPLVETRNPAIGGVIENERIEELPLNGRNSADLIEIAGAVVRTESSSSRSSQGASGGVGYSVAGGQAFGVAFLLDGALHNNPYDNFNLPLPFPDALQEFRVETSSQNAQNGFHSGASVNAATKSGTNPFHGDLFEFFRHHRFNATNPFNVIDPVTRERRDDGLKRNQFGGTLGGPIATDRLFFFGAYQGTRTDERPSDDVRFVPTPAMLAGDFTQVASAACRTAGALALPAPFAGNRIDPALLNPAAVRIARELPDDHGSVRPRRRHQPARDQGDAGHRPGRLPAVAEPLALRPVHGDDLLLRAAICGVRQHPVDDASAVATTWCSRWRSATRWC